MAHFLYYLRRGAAIALGLALTGYSAWASWSHHHDLIGPLAAVSAAGMLVFAEYAARDRHWLHFGVLSILGLAAAFISGSVVLDRVSHTTETKSQAARSMNLPRQEARKALAEAQAEAKAAEAAAAAECASGRKAKCLGLEQRADDARKRADATRGQLTGLGAEVAANPTASLLGTHAETFQLATVLGLPLWLELAAPAVLAYGFAPGRKAPEAKQKAKRPKKRKARKPRKPPAADNVVELPRRQRRA